MAFRILIVEDEIHVADRLSRMLQRIDKNLRTVHTCGGIMETLDWLKKK